MFILYDNTRGNSVRKTLPDCMSSAHIYYIIYEQQSFLASSKMMININPIFNICSEHVQFWQKAGSEFRNILLNRTFISLSTGY